MTGLHYFDCPQDLKDRVTGFVNEVNALLPDLFLAQGDYADITNGPGEVRGYNIEALLTGSLSYGTAGNSSDMDIHFIPNRPGAFWHPIKKEISRRKQMAYSRALINNMHPQDPPINKFSTLPANLWHWRTQGFTADGQPWVEVAADWPMGLSLIDGTVFPTVQSFFDHHGLGTKESWTQQWPEYE